MLAFVDESLRQGPKGLTVVVAALLAPSDAEEARHRVRGLLLRRQVRFHWREESPSRRSRMVETIVGLPTDGVAYVCSPVERRRQERARALCLGRMFWDLGQLGAEHVVIESRGPLDPRDDRTIANARRAKRAPASLRYEFANPRSEPLLWIADALAGATSGHIAGEGSANFELLKAMGRLRIELLSP